MLRWHNDRTEKIALSQEPFATGFISFGGFVFDIFGFLPVLQLTNLNLNCTFFKKMFPSILLRKL